MDERGLDLRLTTFNLLAPCYKRMHALEAPVAAGIADAGTGLLAMRAKTERTARESEFAGLWRERALETVRRGGGGAMTMLWRRDMVVGMEGDLRVGFFCCTVLT